MKFKAPENINSVSVLGEQYNVKDGVIEAPESAAIDLVSVGFEPVQEPAVVEPAPVTEPEQAPEQEQTAAEPDAKAAKGKGKATAPAVVEPAPEQGE